MESSILRRFARADVSDLPPFEDCQSIIQQTLWVLWVGKDKLKHRRMSTERVSLILREIKEVSIRPASIALALNRAGDKVHCYRDGGQIFYEIMKSGKDYLMSLKPQDKKPKGTLEVFYFEPGQKYSSKRILVTGILESLTGELRIVDPYCGERTLDVIKDVKARPIKFLTRLGNINNANIKSRFLRELQDFKPENADIEFRDYPNTDLHDRYIISPDHVVLIGHSIKDLGAKESFAIVLNQASSQNIHRALSENFEKRWNQSAIL
jgi:hypothetical protein